MSVLRITDNNNSSNFCNWSLKLILIDCRRREFSFEFVFIEFFANFQFICSPGSHTLHTNSLKTNVLTGYEFQSVQRFSILRAPTESLTSLHIKWVFRYFAFRFLFNSFFFLFSFWFYERHTHQQSTVLLRATMFSRFSHSPLSLSL